jgi:hypothetical protein
MDLYCQRCGEPWDQYGVYNGDMTEEEKQRFLKGEDCPCCRGKEIKKKPFRAALARALGDILGDDTDGIAAEMEDAEQLWGKEFWE